jgi:hypothetical protein
VIILAIALLWLLALVAVGGLCRAARVGDEAVTSSIRADRAFALAKALRAAVHADAAPAGAPVYPSSSASNALAPAIRSPASPACLARTMTLAPCNEASARVASS